MKISVAQTKPLKGDIETNIDNHKKIIKLAVGYEADIIVFPELSITGYEPGRAKQLATTKDDHRFDEFQIISDNKKIIICVGMPINAGPGININMVIFQPNKPRQVYSKHYLHSDGPTLFDNTTVIEYFFATADKVSIAFSTPLFVLATLTM